MNRAALADTFDRALACHQNGDLAQAEQLYRTLLEQDPGHVRARINLGQVLRRQGRPEAALEQYREATRLPDAPFEAWLNLGNAQAACGELHEAEATLRRAAELDPDSARAHYQLGCVLRRRDRLAEAVACFDRALALEPGYVSAALDKGNVHRALGQVEEAIASYRLGLEAVPDDWRLHYSLARIFDQRNDARFEVHFRRAVENAPDPWSVYFGLAETRMDDRDYASAEELYGRCLELEPERLQAAIGLGAVLHRLDRREEGRQWFNRAAKTDDVGILSKLATIIWEHKYFGEAIALLERMVRLQPDRFDTHLNLAKALVQNWRLDDALAALQEALKRKPDCTEAVGLKAAILSKQGRVDESRAAFLEEMALKGNRFGTASSVLFCSLYSDRLTVEEKFKLHRDLMVEWNERAQSRCERRWDGKRRLRVGYVSADFRDQHPVGIFILPILAHHDRERIETFCYYNSQTWDTSTHRIHAAADHWQDIAGWSDERLAGVIARDGIDILVDLSGHTAYNRLSLFARRAAPVQVSMIGYPHSTGLAAIDCIVADPWVCPPGQEALFAEQVERLPLCLFNYPPEDKYGPVDVEAARNRGAAMFGSFNNIPKVTPSTIDLWVRVLEAVPGSRLTLKAPSFLDEGCRQRYIGLFRERGIDIEHLRVVGPTGLSDMMREYGDIDIALDPIPYNGGTTTVQALWMGVPVITLAGENFCGRMGVSILNNVGLPELIAESPDEYVEIARALAADRKRRIDMRAALRDQMIASPLCDNATYTRELEALYLRLAKK